MRRSIHAPLMRLRSLSDTGHMICFHVRLCRPMLRDVSHDQSWTDHYTRKNFLAGDPSLLWGLRRTGVVRWSKLRRRETDPFGVLSDAAAWGMRFGLVASVGAPGSRSVGSFSRSDRDFDEDEIRQIQDVLLESHDTLEQKALLPQIHVDALEGLAIGMTYDEVCRHLKISRTALKYRLSKARAILGADTNTEAVRIAIDSGQMSRTYDTGLAKALPQKLDA